MMEVLMCSSFGLSLTLMVAAFIGLYYYLYVYEREKNKDQFTGLAMKELPLPLPFELFEKKGAWVIQSSDTQLSARAQVEGDKMCVSFPQSTSGSAASGAKFVATPSGFPTVDAAVSFTVVIPDDFLWGTTSFKGKIGLGLYLGDPGESGGGKWSEGSGRVLVVWSAAQADAKKAQAIAYTYLPTQVHLSGNLPVVHRPISNPPNQRHLTTSVQHKSFFDEVAENEFGVEGIWIFKKGKPLYLERGKANEVSLRIRLNTVKPEVRHDGVLQLTVGNQTRVYDKMVFRTKETCRIEGVRFGAWYGGAANAGAKFGPSTDTKACFKNFKYGTA
jgi:hypothetical protein